VAMTTPHDFSTTARALSRAAALGFALLLSGCVLPFSTLETPSGLYTTNTTYSEIQVSWTGTDTADEVLEVERSEDGVDWTQVGLVNPGQSAFVDQNLDCGTTYYYRVRARSANGAGVSGYSEAISGTTDVCLPDTPSPIAPNTLVEITTPTFTWQAAASAVSYRLIITGASGSVYEDEFDTDDICTGDRCSAVPEVELLRGTYNWQVEAWNGEGSRTTSEAVSFDVAVPEPPTAPNLISPTGAVTTSTPTFTWNEVPEATWYFLQIEGNEQTLLGQWYSALDVCPGEVCSLTVTRPIANGTYTWSMQARNSIAEGPFSAAQRFTVAAEPHEPPGTGSPLGPEGTINTGQPTFHWNAVERATAYKLLIDGPEGALIRETYAAADVCSGGTCSIMPEIALGDSEYTWWIVAQNTYGDGPPSDKLTFTVDLPTPPPAAALISPNGQIRSQLPVYSWYAVEEATEYHLQVNRGDDRLVNASYNASEICGDGTCSAQPDVSLAQGNYRWRVRASNADGDAPWSAEMPFNVFIATVPERPDPVYPEGDIYERKPTYTWDAVEGADEYQIDVSGPSDSGFERWFDADDVCSGNVCEAHPNEQLRYGGHTWRVRARSEGGTSGWSQRIGFEVSRREPGVPQLTSPRGTVSDDTPRFRWSPATGADDYQLQVRERDSGDVVFSRWYDEDDICDDDRCTTSIPNSDALPDDRYEWRVRGRNEFGNGDWSDFMNFKVDD
jgi:hypothetical protein